MHLQNVLPADIEKRSMEIIGEELGQIRIDPEKIDIVKLNAEIAEIVAREQVLRSEIDKIIAEIEG